MVDNSLAIYQGSGRENVNFLMYRLKILSPNHRSRDVIRQRRKFYNVYLFVFFHWQSSISSVYISVFILKCT